VILLDEPFGALDAISRAELQESFDNLRRDLTVTTLLVTHDLAEAGRLAEEVVVMRKGRVEQRGSMRDLIRAPGHGLRRETDRASASGTRGIARMRFTPRRILLIGAISLAQQSRLRSVPNDRIDRWLWHRSPSANRICWRRSSRRCSSRVDSV